MEGVIVCYIDNNGESRFIGVRNPRFFSKNQFNYEVFKNEFPDWNVTAIFDESKNMLSVSELDRENFNKYCSYYGFKPEDYMKELPDTNLRLIGFLPNNRKYTIKLQNTKTGNLIKATPKFVATRLPKGANTT